MEVARLGAGLLVAAHDHANLARHMRRVARRLERDPPRRTDILAARILLDRPPSPDGAVPEPSSET